MLKQMVEYVVKKMVDAPDNVIVTQNHNGAKDIFEIKVDTNDIGKVIGKEGQTIRSLRLLINVLAQDGQEIDIIIDK